MGKKTLPKALEWAKINYQDLLNRIEITVKYISIKN